MSVVDSKTSSMMESSSSLCPLFPLKMGYTLLDFVCPSIRIAALILSRGRDQLNFSDSEGLGDRYRDFLEGPSPRNMLRYISGSLSLGI